MPTESARQSAKTTAWHNYPPDQVMRELDAEQDGLSEAEADCRLKRYGANRLTPPKPQSAAIRFLLQFHNILIYILMAAATMTALLGHWVDSAVIVGVVLISAVIGFIQEGKAEKALAEIRQMLSLTAIVFRDGRRRTITSEQLVPGDIVVLQSGDKVPADMRLLSSKNLRIEEVVLTGEAAVVEKTITASLLPHRLATVTAWHFQAHWWYTAKVPA